MPDLSGSQSDKPMTCASGKSFLDTSCSGCIYAKSIIRVRNAQVTVWCQLGGEANLVQGTTLINAVRVYADWIFRVNTVHYRLG